MATSTPASRATVCASPSETSGSAKIVVVPDVPDLLDEVFELARARLGLRRTPGERELRQAVSPGELAERRMRGDEDTTVAVRETASILGVEGLHLADLVIGRPRAPHAAGDLLDGLGESQRIEPYVRVLAHAEQVE